MEASGRRRWLLAMILAAVVYPVVGIWFGELANSSGSIQGREFWRRLAFLVCAAAFAAQVGYEVFRLRSSPRATAAHASLAVALGALALAVAANVHRQTASQRPLLILALVIWPIITAVPAFLAAFVAAWLARRGKEA